MRLFHELVFESFIEGAGTFTQPLHWGPVMGGIDTMRFMICADKVSGSSLMLQVVAGQQPFLSNVSAPNPGTVLNQALTAGQLNLFSGSIRPTDADAPASYNYHLAVSLSGTNPKAHVRIWVTGRGRG